MILEAQFTEQATEMDADFGVVKVFNKGVTESYVKTVNGIPPDANGNVNVATGGSGLPSVSAEDNGKILQVVNGAWAVTNAPSGGSVPSYTGEVEVE